MSLESTITNKTPKADLSAFMALLVMVAILLRAFIPVGFMPDLNSSQPFKMVICSIDGPKTVLVDKDFNPYKGGETHHDKSAKEHNGPCLFSLNTAFTDIATPHVMISGHWLYTEQPPVTPYERIVQWRFFGNASSTSPPVSSYA